MPQPELTVKLDEIIELNMKIPTDRFVSAVGEGQARFVRLESQFGPMFHIQDWHKLYAGALLETD